MFTPQLWHAHFVIIFEIGLSLALWQYLSFLASFAEPHRAVKRERLLTQRRKGKRDGEWKPAFNLKTALAINRKERKERIERKL
jgi:DNA invertase Pin-like site-specific DNA recombinase